MKARAVLHFALAQIVQLRMPARIRREIIGHSLGQENVAGIATIHHPLRHIDAGAGHVGAFIRVHDFVDRSAMNAHPELQLRMLLVRAT